jgi:glutamate 5-kinase
MAEFDRQQLMSSVKRVVVKVGSSTLSENSELSSERLDQLAHDLTKLKCRGVEVVLVTSGAIVAGTRQLGFNQRPGTIPELQAAAAVGQIQLMQAYQSRLQQYGQIPAMALLTQEDFTNRQRYVHISDTLLTLLRLGAIPIINENDTVTVDEIKVGDNDTLAAYVTNLIDAYLLIILSDQKGFYSADPRTDTDAKLINVVPKIDDTIRVSAGNSSTDEGTGGMITKLLAAEIVTGSGGLMVLADGSEKNILNRIMDGEAIGSLFLPQKRMSSRQRWIAYSRPPKGQVFVDAGAHHALLNHGGSLLPCGVREITGKFEFGDTISCRDQNDREFARGLVNYSTQEAQQIIGKNTHEIEKVLGYRHYDEIIHRDNLVLIT